MNLSEMRTIVRRELRDEDETNYRWTDDELARYIARAVEEFSEHLPREQTATPATTAGSRELDISGLEGIVMVTAVEYPPGQFPPRYQPFSLWGDTLTLLGDEVPDGSNARIFYGTLHTLDTEGSTIPACHEALVATGACGSAATGWAVYAVNRVNAGGDDTPERFLAWGNEKLAAFHRELRRLGRRNRVRARHLYTPAAGGESTRTDYGP